MGKKVRVSQCMIVKNEEAKIARALSWGKDVIWERIVVDTGSTDRTVEIAESMGASVWHFPWQDDFSAAKNFALEKAKGNWIFFLDADEYPSPGDEKKILREIEIAEHLGYDGISTGLANLDDEGRIGAIGAQVRLFRNSPKLRYYRRVHEQLKRTNGDFPRLTDATEEILILHDGYQTETYAGKKKSERNRRLLERELADHPDDYEIMGYLGDVYQTDGEQAEARRWFSRAVSKMPDTLPEYDRRSEATLASLIEILAREKEEQELFSVYQRAVRLFPKAADFDYLMGCYMALAERWGESADYLASGIEKLDQYGAGGYAMLLSANLVEAYGDLALAYLKAGRGKEAVETSVAFLQVKPYDGKVLRILLECLRGEEENGKVSANAQDAAYCREVLNFLEKLYPFSDGKNRFFVRQVALGAGWPMLEQVLTAKWGE